MTEEHMKCNEKNTLLQYVILLHYGRNESVANLIDLTVSVE